MGRIFLHPHDPNDDTTTDGEFTPQNQGGEEEEEDDYYPFDEQSREEGEVIENETGEEEEEELDPQHCSSQRSSFFSFPRLWRQQRSTEQHDGAIGEGRYTRIATSDFNPVSDDEGEEEENHQEENYNRNYETALSEQNHDELAEHLPHQNEQGVHYHIYLPESVAERWLAARFISDDDDESYDRRRSRSKGTPWKWLTLLALITHIIYWYGPSVPPATLSRPPPPPSSDLPLSWKDYWRHQTNTLLHVSTDALHLVTHVTYWSLVAMQQDWQSFYTKWVLQDELEKEENKNIRWTFPSQWNLRAQHGNNHDAVIHSIPLMGQDAALEHVENILNTWSNKRNDDKPLVLYLTGGKAVGKQSLAYILLQALVPSPGSETSSIQVDCVEEFAKLLADNPIRAHFEARETEEEDKSIPSMPCPLLRLTHHDFSGYDSNYYPESKKNHKSFASSLYDRIAAHAVSFQGGNQGGSILLLQHVDMYPQDVFSEVMQRLHSNSAIFRSTIVILTSKVGTVTMEKWVRKRIMQQLGRSEQTISLNMQKLLLSAEGESMLRYEIQQYHQQGTKDDNPKPTLSMEEWNIIPMLLLDATAMGEILMHLATVRSIHLTPSAVSRLLDALEWHQWLHKTSGEVLQTWSPDGALPLLKLWEDRVQRSLRYLPADCLSDDERGDSMMVLDCDNGGVDQFVLRKCQKGETNSVEVIDNTNGMETVKVVDDGQVAELQCPRMRYSSGCGFYL